MAQDGAVLSGPDSSGSPRTAAPVTSGSPVSTLGQRLRRVREGRGLALREVARQLGVSPSFISQLENGKSQPSVATLYALSQLLDVSIDQLFVAEGPVAGDTVVGDTVAGDTVAGEVAAEAVAAGAGGADPGDAVPDHAVVADQPADVLAADVLAADVLAAEVPGGATVTPFGQGQVVSRVDVGSPVDAWPARGTPERLSVTRPGERSRIVMDSGVVWEQLATNTGSQLEFIEIVYPPGSSSTTDGRMLRHHGYECGYLIEGELDVTVGFDVFTLRAGESLGLDSATPHLFTNRGDVPARGVWFVRHTHP